MFSVSENVSSLCRMMVKTVFMKLFRYLGVCMNKMIEESEECSCRRKERRF